jgi:hypothetical protein
MNQGTSSRVANPSELLMTRVQALSEQLLRHVVPIFSEGKGRPEPQATGVLVSDASAVFLISAAHAFVSLANGANLFFYAADNITRRLAGSVRFSADADVGVLRLLEPASAPSFKATKRPLSLHALTGGALPRHEKHYLLTGFPGSKSRFHPVHRHVAAEPYSHLCSSASESAYCKLGRAPATHIVMPLDHNKAFWQGSTQRTFPSPRGMSGSPVWLMYDSVGPNDPIQTPMVGVLIEYHKQHDLLVASDVQPAIDLIRQAF